MNRLLVCILLISLLVASCTSKENKLQSKIKEAGDAYYKGQAVDSLYNVGMNFAKEFPKNKMSAKVLITTANYYYQKEMIAKALQGYELYIKNYPDSSGMYDALLNAGWIYDGMRNGPKAVEYWNKFLQRFPEGTMSESIRKHLPDAGKSADEILEKFEKTSEEPVY